MFRQISTSVASPNGVRQREQLAAKLRGEFVSSSYEMKCVTLGGLLPNARKTGEQRDDAGEPVGQQRRIVASSQAICKPPTGRLFN